MANSEQSSIPGGKIEKRLVFDEKKGKWRMESTGKHHRRGHPISPDNARRRDEGLQRYWQKRREAGKLPMPIYVADKISEGLQRYWQERRKQQQPPEQRS